MKRELERLYRKYAKKEHIGDDPVVFIHNFGKKEDVEIAGLVSSVFAYGKVRQIKSSLAKIFHIMKNSPRRYLERGDLRRFRRDFGNFRHRFTGPAEISYFMAAVKRLINKKGTIENAFSEIYLRKRGNIPESIYEFAGTFFRPSETPTLIPDPSRKSAFKRFNLFLRWMVRKDEIDAGIWTEISKSALIIPLDAHMGRIAAEMGISTRTDSSMKTALQITDFFRRVNPEDPVRYDFALTRPGINGLKEELKLKKRRMVWT